MRQFVKIAFVAAFAAVAGYSIYTTQKTDTISDLALANVEALAQNEGSGGIYCCGNYGTCMNILGGGVIKGLKFFSPCY